MTEKWVNLPFAGPSNSERSRQADSQACVNLYPVKSPTPSDPNRVVLYPTPGYDLCQTVSALNISGTGAARALTEVNGTVYLVSGSRLLKATYVGPGFTFQAVGTLYTSTGRCSVVCNTVELAISDGQYGYTYHLATGAIAGVPTTGGFPTQGVTNLAFQDGYVLGAAKGSSRLVQSDLLAAGSFPALAFADVASFPDALTAVYSDQRQLYAFGPKLGEVRFDSGATPFAFEKTQGALIEAGCVSPHTMQKVGGTLVWLAATERGRAFVAALNGYAAQPISSPALNEAIQRYPTISDAYATAYREGDAEFYCLTFPTAGVTWVIDLASRVPHQRSVQGGIDRPAFLVPYRDRQLAGGTDGNLYWMSQDHLTDGTGTGLARSRTTATSSADGRPLFVREVELDLETGMDPQTTAEPLATLELSTDGGVTFKTLGVKSLGATGDTRRRVSWRAGGWGRELTFRVTVTDAARCYLYGLRARVQAGGR